jgi:hypothetical protein
MNKLPMFLALALIFAVMKWFYLAGAAWFVSLAILNLISDFCLRARKGADLFAGGGGHQLFAPALGHGAGRVHHRRP